MPQYVRSQGLQEIVGQMKGGMAVASFGRDALAQPNLRIRPPPVLFGLALETPIGDRDLECVGTPDEMGLGDSERCEQIKVRGKSNHPLFMVSRASGCRGS